MDLWRPNYFYTSGDQITDSNSNDQEAQSSGTTGSIEPDWAEDEGDETEDNEVTWQRV